MKAVVFCYALRGDLWIFTAFFHFFLIAFSYFLIVVASATKSRRGNEKLTMENAIELYCQEDREE